MEKGEDGCAECGEVLLDTRKPVSPWTIAWQCAGCAFIMLLAWGLLSQSRSWNAEHPANAIMWAGIVACGSVGALLGVVVPVMATVVTVEFIRCTIIGRTVYYSVEYDGSMHRHFEDLSNGATQAVLQGRIGGWFRRTRLLKPSPLCDYLVCATWGGTMMTVRTSAGQVYHDQIAVILPLLAKRRTNLAEWLRESAIRATQ